MTFFDFSIALSLISPAILSIGSIVGMYHYNRINAMQKSILLYLVLMLGVDVMSRLIGLSGNNLIVLPIFSLIEMVFFVFFYNRYLLSKPNKILVGLGCVGTLFIVAEILQYFVFNTLNVKQFQPYAKVADNFIVIIMALVFFYQKMNSYSETKWDNFKLNIAILVFFTFNTIIFLPFNFLINESSGVKYYFWTGNLIMLLLFYIYLTSLIWKNGRVKQVS